MTAQTNPVAPKRRAPALLGARGTRLWREVMAAAELDPARIAMLEEACRMADRLDALDHAIRDAENVYGVPDEKDPTGQRVILVVDEPLTEARLQQNVFKQLLAALRLPDPVTGAQDQHRGGARGGTYAGAAKVSALDKARAKAAS